MLFQRPGILVAIFFAKCSEMLALSTLARKICQESTLTGDRSVLVDTFRILAGCKIHD
jgi:hypothetical protein